MEFVLNTTTSTPYSSRSGSSIIKFGDYREDEILAIESMASFDRLDVGRMSSEDDEFHLLDEFEEETLRLRLYSMENCVGVHLPAELQRFLEIEIGVHVTRQFRWKMLERQRVLDCFSGIDEQSNFSELRELLLESETNSILVGYAAAMDDDDGDEFVFFTDDESARTACEIIRQLENNERCRNKKFLVKYSGRWHSLGSEVEVDAIVERARTNKVEVHVERLQSDEGVKRPLQVRLVRSIRDGYVELLSHKEDTIVIPRRSVDVAIQTTAYRVNMEQQTNPAFPANAWTQYHYDIEDIESNVFDAKIDDEQELSVNHGEQRVELSQAMKDLLEILDFNNVDLHSDDYSRLAKIQFPKSEQPYSEEALCFVQPQLCKGRTVTTIEWNPFFTGEIVVSYSWDCQATLGGFYEAMKRSILHQWPILVWSFADDLFPILQLNTRCEISCLSFCPYDESILIGGTKTGQLLIWDLSSRDKEKKIDYDFIKTREPFYAAMNWLTIKYQTFETIRPTVVTPREFSHRLEVSCIKWLGRKHLITSTGQIQESVKPTESFRHFATASRDGSVLFWDLDYIDANRTMKANVKDKRKSSFTTTESIDSVYQRLDGNIRPIYAVTIEKPMTNLLIDEGQFRYEAGADLESAAGIELKIVESKQETPTNKLIATTILGTIESAIWEGFMYKEGKPEVVNQADTFCSIHDGPIVGIERNSFVSELLLSFGSFIFAIWNVNCTTSPLVSRIRSSKINSSKWSTTKPSQFIVALDDGTIEVWDISMRIDAPVISHFVGMISLTTLAQNKMNDAIAIGDSTGLTRIMNLPKSITECDANEPQNLEHWCKNETRKKEKLFLWMKIHAKKSEVNENKTILTRDVSRKTLEKTEMTAVKKLSRALKSEVKSTNPKLKKLRRNYGLTERMQRKWEAMNVKYLNNELFKLKHIDPETIESYLKPVRDCIEYERMKQTAIEANLRKADDELNHLRERLLPQPSVDEQKETIETVRDGLSKLVDIDNYKQIESEAEKKINQAKSTKFELNFCSILAKAHNSRAALGFV